MTTAIDDLTLEQYLNYHDNPDTRYELENGKLVSMAQLSREQSNGFSVGRSIV